MKEFLKKRLVNKPGSIVDSSGKILGEHEGIHFYTIGQRK
jgi:tRNA-uridine 2-sulfurtransferase